MELNTTPFWVRLYDLPMATRSVRNISHIAGRCGEVLNVDSTSMDGFSRSVRVRVQVDIRKLMKQGTKVEINNTSLWIPFKYECLPAFYYVCGMLGHMKRECDLGEDCEDIRNIQDDKLPFGEWMRATPGKLAAVSTGEHRAPNDNFSLRKNHFERFKQTTNLWKEAKTEERNRDMELTKGDTEEVEDVSINLAKVCVSRNRQTEEVGKGIKAGVHEGNNKGEQGIARKEEVE
ncbi:hypothetical protein ACS0TY_033007 [Phlomoides rotata]